jgi:hypothetical protein
MDNRERLKKYLRGVAGVFNNNGPKIKFKNKMNEYTTLNNTDQEIDNLINELIGSFTDNEINNALKSPQVLDDIVIMLIKKITQNPNEPLWSIVEYQGIKYFIPSEEAIKKYDIQSKGQNGNFLYSDFEIPLLESPNKSIFDIFNIFKGRGGKKSKRRRRTKSRTKSKTKQRVKRRTIRKTK